MNRLRTLAALAVLTLVSTPSAAQQVLKSREILASGFGFLDDVETTPQGEILVSHPATNTVGFLQTGTNTITPLYTGTVHGMGLEADGQGLWVAEWFSGELKRIEVATGAVTLTLGGLFAHPHEVLCVGPGELLVGDLDIADFHNGTGSVHRVQIPPTGPPNVTLLASGIPGGVDVEQNGAGRIFCASLSGTSFDEILPGGVRQALVHGLLQPTDIILGPDNEAFISTILVGEILRIPLDEPTLSTVDILVGQSLGPGCEDFAWDGDALLISMSDGTLRRALVRGSILQHGAGFGGLRVAIHLEPDFDGPVNYLLGASLGLSPVPLPLTTHLGTTNFKLALDPVFSLSQTANNGLFFGMNGVIPAGGRGEALTNVPIIPGLSVDLYYQAVYLQGSLIVGASDVLEVRLWSL